MSFTRRKQSDRKDARGALVVESSEAGRLRFSQATVDRVARERAAKAAQRTTQSPAPQR
jgi:hypothetical protein